MGAIGEVFLTGGTGFVGRYVIDALRDGGFRVRCLVRRGSEGKLARRDVEIVFGDVTDFGSLRDGMFGCDAVINLVGIVREKKREGVTFERVHFEGTKNCVDAAMDLGIGRFLQMSALGSRKGAVSRYHITKYLAEKYVRKSGLVYTIFRPSFVFGREDKSFNYFISIMKKTNSFPVFGDGKYRMQPVSVLNVAQGYARYIDNERAHYKTFDVCGPRIYEFDELIDTLAKIINRRVSKIHIPLGIAKSLVYLFGRFEFSPLTYDGLVMLLEDNVCENMDFYSTLGIKPIAFEEGVRKYAGI